MEKSYLLWFLFFTFLLIEILLKRAPFKGIDWQNHFLDFWAILQSSAIVGPVIAYSSAWLLGHFFPEQKDLLLETPYWAQFIAFLFLEDMMQYWWHRSAHTFPVLWPLHRVHHAAPYLGIRVWLRNGLFYTLLMPNQWFATALIYLGFGHVYFFYTALKLLVTAGAHSELRWDSFLYRYKWLHPLAWLLEHTVSTPATHFAHHALRNDDGIGHYNGNFGNLLFLWDIIFGSALITRKYPAEFGLQEDRDLGTEKWYVQIFYPIFRSKRGGKKAKSKSPVLSSVTQQT